MFWLIIGFIVFIILTIYFIRSNEYAGWGEKIGSSVLVLITSAMLSVLVWLFASLIISAFAETDYYVASDTKIIALKDNQNINGSFYIMGGYVDEDLYYYYAAETELGYKTEKVSAENSYIKYTDDAAHIETYRAEFTNDYVNFFAFPMHDNRYIIYCPEGTVTNEFDIDLE